MDSATQALRDWRDAEATYRAAVDRYVTTGDAAQDVRLPERTMDAESLAELERLRDAAGAAQQHFVRTAGDSLITVRPSFTGDGPTPHEAERDAVMQAQDLLWRRRAV